MRLVERTAHKLTVFQSEIFYQNHANVLRIKEFFTFFIDMCRLAIIQTVIALIEQNNTCHLACLVVNRAPLA